MWSKFLEDLNGIAIQSVREKTDWDFQVYSDVAGAGGFGLYLQGHWCAEEWPRAWKEGGRSIAFLEFFPLLVQLVLWVDSFADTKVNFRVDNMTVIEVVNRQSASDPTY